MRKIYFFIFVLTFGLYFVDAGANARGKKAKQEEVKTEDEVKKEKKELPFGVTPYFYSGPDTGIGGGVAGLIRDLGKKVGRDLVFSFDYTEKRYETYSIEYKEPQFLSKNGWGRISISYANRPSRRYYGIGNELAMEGVCNYAESHFLIEPRYDYWWEVGKNRIGLKVQFHYQLFTPRDGELDDPNDPDYSRPISEMYPDVYESDTFRDGGATSGPGITLIHQHIRDKFPIAGGRDEIIFPVSGIREELFYANYDKAFGSNFNYNQFRLNFVQYIPLGSDWTVLALRQQLQIIDGDVPFWDMSGFGGDDSIRAIYEGRYRDKNSTLFTVELRQAFDFGFDILGLIRLHTPMVVLFYDYGRVFEDVNDITDDLGGYHYGYGASFRFIITPTVIIRFDFAMSEEESALYITSGWPF